MKPFKLMSMTDFVLNIDEQTGSGGHYDKIVRYANFLKQPLKLGMFVPCDLDGNVLDKPEQYEGALEFAVGKDYDDAFNYQQAKERVLFDGFISGGGIAVAKSICQCLDNVESLTREKIPIVDLTLTPTAIKQLGL